MSDDFPPKPDRDTSGSIPPPPPGAPPPPRAPEPEPEPPAPEPEPPAAAEPPPAPEAPAYEPPAPEPEPEPEPPASCSAQPTDSTRLGPRKPELFRLSRPDPARRRPAVLLAERRGSPFPSLRATNAEPPRKRTELRATHTHRLASCRRRSARARTSRPATGRRCGPGASARASGVRWVRCDRRRRASRHAG